MHLASGRRQRLGYLQHLLRALLRPEDGTPEDNEMAHCCYCGKRLAQELIAEDDDE
jgi:hypothetical protein